MTATKKQKPIVTLMKFNSMSPARRRVVIAKDTILHIESDRFVAGGGWCTLQDGYFDVKNKSAQVRDVLTKSAPKSACYGCALGAIFYATAMRFNDVQVKDVLPTGTRHTDDFVFEDFRDFLGRFFDDLQIRMIEACYELGCGYFGISEVPGSCRTWAMAAGIFPKRDRLTAICKNIIRHRGTFDPSDLRME